MTEGHNSRLQLDQWHALFTEVIKCGSTLMYHRSDAIV